MTPVLHASPGPVHWLGQLHHTLVRRERPYPCPRWTVGLGRWWFGALPTGMCGQGSVIPYTQHRPLGCEVYGLHGYDKLVCTVMSLCL